MEELDLSGNTQTTIQKSPFSEDEEDFFVQVESPITFKEPKEHKKQKSKKLTEIEPEIFEQMKTNQGISIADYGKKGLKVFLFFFSSIGSENNGTWLFI
jgi:hypothetical protein